jgi:four helix bundle protein
MKDFQDLVVWQKSHGLTLQIYRLTKGFPRDELYGLSSQMRRAAVSIAANIAEGSGRRSGDIEFRRYLEISLGSATEVEYFLILSKDLAYISDEDFNLQSSHIQEIKKMLVSFIQKLQLSKKLVAKN